LRTGELSIRRDTLTSSVCPACDATLLRAAHARRGTWVYLEEDSTPPFRTSDLHSNFCTNRDTLTRIMQVDQHLSFTGEKWR
jgi:hypothetical protein